ncbi:MAG: class I SAM-dependent methyltransferase [Gemmataceae bacterium]
MGKFDVRDGAPFIETAWNANELAAQLQQWAPWRHRIVFSNGVSTVDLDRGELWTERPLGKVLKFEPELTLGSAQGGRALDLGCNAGYNALYLASKYGMTVTGVDSAERHVSVARSLAELSGTHGATFVQADANTYWEPDAFDLILHLGTLYHLRHPMLSLDNCVTSLRKGGRIALETQGYEGDDPLACKCLIGATPDPTNWWALGAGALKYMMEASGLKNVRLVGTSRVAKLGPNMPRYHLIGQK